MANSIVCTTRLEGSPIQYQVRWSARARRLRLAVSDAGVVVTLPQGINAREAESFIQQHAGWLKAQMHKLEKARQAKSSHELPDDIILLRGKPTQVRVVEEADRKTRALVMESGGRLILHLPQGKSQLKGSLIESALKQMARTELEQAVAVQARMMNVSPRKVTIRDQRTRWGSCSSKGTLSFNWRLVMAPPEIMRYVVVHELAHLKVPNHSAAFWKLVSQYFPGYVQARQWLKHNSAQLHPRW